MRNLPNGHIDAESTQSGVKLLVEFGHRQAVEQRERLDLAAVRSDHQAVINEVELDLERGTTRSVHPPCCQASHIDIEGSVPPVVSRIRGGKAHLPNDLKPQMQCVLRVLPLFQRQLREARLGNGAHRSPLLA